MPAAFRVAPTKAQSKDSDSDSSDSGSDMEVGPPSPHNVM